MQEKEREKREREREREREKKKKDNNNNLPFYITTLSNQNKDNARKRRTHLLKLNKTHNTKENYYSDASITDLATDILLLPQGDEN